VARCGHRPRDRIREPWPRFPREGTTWNDASDSAWEFTIAPRIYQTFWFPFLATGIIASAAWATWHIRMAQARRRFAITLAERARVSREVDNAAIGEKLVQLRRRIDEHIEEGRELIWNLRSPTLEKYDLVAALRRIADEVVAGTNVRVELVTSGKVHSCSPRAERELLRIGQEAITNAVRHGKPTLVKVELLFDDKAVHLRVVDDGCGFAPNATLATADRHCGLVMMRERAEDIHGTCTVTSSPGGGTRVTATAPLVPERA
jgi:signal transduction histidine kinase